MAYISSDDMVARFGSREMIELTDRTYMPPAAIDATVIGNACADASALVDSYLAARYALPISSGSGSAPGASASIPPILLRVTTDIARFYLYGSRAEVGGPVERAYKQAVAWLERVSKGIVKLELASNVVADEATAVTAEIVVGRSPVFTRDFRGL